SLLRSYRDLHSFLHDALPIYVILRAGEHRRLYLVATQIRSRAAHRYLDAFAARDPEITEHLLDVLRVNQRPDLRAWIERMADFEDRKSTRLNSSHQIISYAVF